MDPSVFKAITDFGLAVVATVVLAWFVFKLVSWWRVDRNDEIADLRRQRDAAFAGWRAQADATDKLAEAFLMARGARR